MNIPEQYLPVMPYIIVENASKFSDFVKYVFDATEQLIVPAENNKIMHGELRIADSVIMFADTHEEWTSKPAGMYIYVNSVDNIYKKALEQGAKSLHQPRKEEYGYTAGFEDAFGNWWFIVEAV